MKRLLPTNRLLLSLAPALALLFCVLLWPRSAWADEASEFQATLDKGLAWAYLVSFGTGIITSLTPCVYPMIPITVAVFGSKDEGTTRKKAFVLAACYVGGMGVLFAVLGVSFAMAGGQAGQLLANPKVIIPLALLLVVLATSLFGAFEIRLPYALQNRLNTVGGKGYGGAFGMGLVGGLVAAPCTGPFLAGMLIWVASTGSPVVGGTLLFTYALGVGVLFFVLAVTSMSIPKSGAWMDGIKSFGGIGLIAVAIHFLRPVWPAIDALGVSLSKALGGPMILTLAGIGIAVIGIVLGGIHLSFKKSTTERARKSVGVVLIVAGATAVASGLLTPEKPLEWTYEEEPAFALAKESGKGVVIDFGATWCIPCKAIEKVFGEPAISTTVAQSFVPLKFDVSKQTDAEVALQNKYKATSLPAVLFLDAEGNELHRYTNKNASTSNMLKAIEKAKEKLAKSKLP